MICDRNGCGGEAAWRPAFLLYARAGTIPARAYINLGLCDDCRDETTVDDLLTEEAWQGVLSVFRNERKAAPARELVELDWTLIEDEEKTK